MTEAGLITALERRLGLPRPIELSAQTWIAATVLGRLRTLVNDSHRAPIRDRGPDKNSLNDLQGAVGELVGLALTEERGLRVPARGLLDLEGSVDEPDLTVGSPSISLDVKCHLDASRKKYFLINEKARQRSVARGVSAFLPVVSSAYCRNAQVGRLVPVEDVQTWTVRRLGVHQDPAHAVELRQFAASYLPPRDESQSNGSWGPRLVEDHRLEEVARSVGPELVERLTVAQYSLDGLTFREVRRSLLHIAAGPPIELDVPRPRQPGPTPRGASFLRTSL